MALLGCEAHDVGSTPDAWFQRIHPEDRQEVTRAIETHLADGSTEFDVPHRMVHADGSCRWMSCHAVVQRNADGTALRVMGFHKDATAATVTDPLTGLPNRLLLTEQLNRSLERAGRHEGFHFALLLVDLDRPPSSDGQRPSAGDPLLIAAARRLETSLRGQDLLSMPRHNDLVARLDGDQFAILLDGLKEVAHSKLIAERILAQVLGPFRLGDREVFLSASVGVAVSATGYSRADDLISDAATALHRAKQLGKGRCEVFDTAVLSSAQTELNLEREFQDALERREFQVVYQPIVSLETHDVAGFEALLRWNHPVRGTIPPAEFIRIAERTQFIVTLGHWTLRQACLQLKAWQDSRPLATDVWVSVNLSGVQLRYPQLAEQVREALRESSLEPRHLTLEITESLAMDNLSSARALLLQIRALGVRISLDDFGTGYSSLSSLRQLPVDAIKVDRSFVRGIETNDDMTTMLRGLTTMAQQLGLYVVAEGIETDEQLALIRSVPCEFGQGYLFSRPLDHEAAGTLLKAGLPRRRDDRPPVTHLEHVHRQPWSVGTSLMGWVTPRTLAAGVTLILLAAVGLPSRFAEAPGLDAQTAMRSNVPAAVPPARVESPARGTVPQVRSQTQTSTPPPPAAATAPRSPVQPVRPSAAASTSLAVVHQHRLGSCRGSLVVSSTGVTFVPDDAKGDAEHAFNLGHTDFLHDLKDDSLTIQAKTRTYRFKSGLPKGGDLTTEPLRQLVASIINFRDAPFTRPPGQKDGRTSSASPR